MSELLPCPFCKSRATTAHVILWVNHKPSDRYFPSCLNHHCVAYRPSHSVTDRTSYSTKAEAITAWNTRADGWQPIETYQDRVQTWMLECFGAEIAADKAERNHRFTEESLELVQACGATADECHQLVDYVFSRPVGEMSQEVGGVMNTLAALCLAQDLNMHKDGETELARVWTIIPQIRAKRATKPKHSPLPTPPTAED